MSSESVFTNSAGREWTVRVVDVGDSYGRNDCLIHDGDFCDEPMIEFYDRTYAGDDFGPRGQFVSRYYASDLFDERTAGYGIDLQGDAPDWEIDGETLSRIYDWVVNE